MKLKFFSLVAITSIFCGCISVDTTPENVKSVSYSVGYTAGIVANQFKIDDNSRNEICSIMNEIKSYIPQKDQTLSEVWTPIANQHTQKLLTENKITEQQKFVILNTFKIITDGVDYLMTNKLKNIKVYADLTEIAVNNFIDGFLTVFSPSNVMSFGPAAIEFVDKDTYNYLMSSRAPEQFKHKKQKRKNLKNN